MRRLEHSEIDRVLAKMLIPRGANEIRCVAQYMAAEKDSIPREYDNKMLARCRKSIARNCTDE